MPPVGLSGARCLTYDDCINFGTEDNTTSFNGCAPITGADATDNDKTSGWCKEGDFWQAANYTVRNTVTVPWDGTSLDVSISAEIIEKLNVIFANASGYNQTTCLCRDNRMRGWTPHMVMVAHTHAPTAAGVSTLPPTTTYTPPPTTLPPTTTPPTTTPTSAAPTAPTPAPTKVPTTFPPTPAPLPMPFEPEMCTGPYAVWSVCTFDPQAGGGSNSTVYGSVACNSSVYAASCKYPSTCPEHRIARVSGSMCGSSPTVPFTLSEPEYNRAYAPDAFNPYGYFQCTMFDNKRSGACVRGSGSVGVPWVYYCEGSSSDFTGCTASYPCTELGETYFGDPTINLSTSACLVPTPAPIAPPTTASPTTSSAPVTPSPTHMPSTTPTVAPTKVPTPYYPLGARPLPPAIMHSPVSCAIMHAPLLFPSPNSNTLPRSCTPLLPQ